MESYDKSVELKLVTWQYHEYGVWKNFEDNPSCKGDNVVLEQGFQAGRKTLTLQHGWYETVRSLSLSFSLSHTHTHIHTHIQYDINFTKKTSQKKRTSGSKKIRRWVAFTKKQLHAKYAREKREAFLKKNKSAAKKFWQRYKSGDAPVDHAKMFADLKFPDMYVLNLETS